MVYLIILPNHVERLRGRGVQWTSTTITLMAEDHVRQNVGEYHPYREFEGMQPSI
jgi:hypothetical protein